MEPPNQRLRHQTESRTGSEAALDATRSVRAESTETFESPEALIAFDRARTPVPDGLRERVAGAVSGKTPTEPPAPTPWWRRLF